MRIILVAAWRTGQLATRRPQSYPSRLKSLHGGVLSYAWSCGPPIDMKICSSQSMYAKGAWTAKICLHSGWSETVFEFGRERAFWTNLCRATPASSRVGSTWRCV